MVEFDDMGATSSRSKRKLRPERTIPRGNKTDPDGPLLPQHEAFCQEIAAGLSGAEAYRKCVATGWMDRDVATGLASKLLSNPKVWARCNALKLEFNEFLGRKLAFTKQTLGKYLVDVIETPIGEITANHKFASKLTLNDEGGVKSIEMFSKESATDKLMKLAGMAEPETHNVVHGTTEDIRAAMDKMFSKKAQD